MRRTASEVLRNLEMRVAQLEKQAKYIEWEGQLYDYDALNELSPEDVERFESEVDGLGRVKYNLRQKEKSDKAYNEFRRLYKKPYTKLGKILERELSKIGAEVRIDPQSSRENIGYSEDFGIEASGHHIFKISILGAEIYDRMDYGHGSALSGGTMYKELKEHLTKGNNAIRKILRKLGFNDKRDEFELVTVKAKRGEYGGEYNPNYGVTHTIYVKTNAMRRLDLL